MTASGRFLPVTRGRNRPGAAVYPINKSENHLVDLSTSEVAQNSRCEHCLLLKEVVKKFCGIDLYSNNSVVVITDETDRVLVSRST